MSGEHTIGSLRYAVLDDAIVIPTALTSSTGTVRGGIAAAENPPPYIHQLRQVGNETTTITRFRHDDPTGKFDLSTAIEVPGTAVYLGPAHRHFGHFITESVTRYWLPLADSQFNRRLVVLPEVDSLDERRQFTAQRLLSWQREIYSFLGAADLKFVTQPMRFERLVVPEQAAILFSHRHDACYREALKRRAEQVLGPKSKPGRRIMLTRSGKTGGVAGERYVAQFLSAHGYEVVQPESLSVRSQLEMLWNADKVVAVQGSALHGFNLLGRVTADVLVIQRTGAAGMDAFLRTLRPYVASVMDVRLSKSLSQSASTQDLRLVDLPLFLNALNVFDSSIEPSAFDFCEFWDVATDDILNAWPKP